MSYFEPDLEQQVRRLTEENRDLRQALHGLEQKVALLFREVGAINQRQAAIEESDPYGRKRARHVPQLPLEVLRSIFILCLPEEGDAVLNPHESPLLLGLVCKQWRDLAWSTTKLWDSLHIDIPNLDYEPFQCEPLRWHGFIIAIESWLKRSGSRPLSLSLVDNEAIYTLNRHPCTQLIAKVIQQISTESARWEKLRLQLRGMDMRLHSQAFPRHVPVLETFAFRTLNEGLVGPNTDDDVYPINIGFHPIISSPSLRTLQLGDVSLLGIYSHNGPRMTDYSNIVELSLGDDSQTTGFSVLNADQAVFILIQLQHSRLRTCRLVLRPILRDPSHTPPTSPINLYSLQAFTVIIPDVPREEEGDLLEAEPEPENDVMLEQHLFAPLYLPSLQSFEYSNELRGYSRARSSFPFIHLLSKPHQLETLKLSASSSQGAFKQLLDLGLRIKELHLSADLSTPFLPMIGATFPDLEILKLDCSAPVDSAQLLLNIDKGRGEHWPRLWQERPEPILRRLVEQARHSILNATLAFIGGRFQHGYQLVSEGRVIQYRSPLRKVDFRLNERLRTRALAQLAPFIADGLTVSFRDDYFNIPLPNDHPKGHS